MIKNAKMENARKFRHSTSGSALVELALVLPVLVLLFVGIVNYALMIQKAMRVTEAATAGAAYGAMPGNEKDFTGMQNAATNAAAGVSGFSVTAVDFFTCSPGGASVSSSTTCPGSGTPLADNGTPFEYVQVQTSATVPPLLAYTGISSLTLKGKALFRVPWTP